MARQVFSSTTGTALLLALLAGAPEASAAPPTGATDIKIKKPNVLMLVDTSGSMMWRLDGSDANCGSSNGKGRWAILSETLTGTISNLACSSSVALQSNDCRPYLNGESDMQTHYTNYKTGWPRRNVGHADTKDAVVFCGKQGQYNKCTFSNWVPGQVCQLKNGDWEQSADGLLDTFAKQLRFGLMTFDSNAVVPPPTTWSDGSPDSAKWYLPWGRVSGDAAWGSPNICQTRTDGTQCRLTSAYTWYGTTIYDNREQWSYWFADASNNWMTGGRAGLGRSIVSYDYWGNERLTSEATVDIGARNTWALPSEGRLIGFGPADWDVSEPSVTGCASEDDCTAAHNEMVQKAILGASQALDHNTPLGAFMKDAYQFIALDNQTVGVHLPHAVNLNPATKTSIQGKLGVTLDTYYNNGCRDTAVILVTDGNPTEDIDQKPAYWANRLLTETGTRTFVIGISVDKAWWNPTGLPLGTIEQNCKALTEDDFGNGKMCQPHPSDPLKWKYAEAPYSNLLSGSQADKIEACCTLLQTAIEGGTDKPYFPSDQTELKQGLAKVLSNVAGGTLSRTTPVFSSPSTSFLQGGGTPDAPATYFELRSSMEVTPDDTLWRGHLERVRYACDDASGSYVPVIQPVATNRGDRFEDNLDTTAKTRDRKFFTVIPMDTAFTTNVIRGSLRPTTGNPNSTDNLFTGGRIGDFRRFGNTPSTGNDTPVIATSIGSTIDSFSGTPKAADVIGLSAGDTGTCNTQTGSSSLPTCAARVFNWYGGVTTPGGPTVSRIPASSRCPGGFCSAMGAIYRSSPVVVPPPQASDEDSQNFKSVRSDGSQSFVQRYAARPTMVYAQTIDGQLHAFTLSMNDFASGPFDPPAVPVVDELDNNELWTFIPPAVLPSLWSNFNVHSRQTDGQLTWNNVVFERPYASNAGVSSTDTTNWDYRTILVAASGPAPNGGFYYALDVTDPTAPRFLWQLSTAGNGGGGKPGDSLFGASAPGAAITHVRYTDPTDGNRQKIIAVAVLPGGSPSGSAPTAVRDRRMNPTSYWDGTNRTPRSRIRDWGSDAVPSRSLTIVELKTGRIIARLTGSMADNPRNPSFPTDLSRTLLSNNVVVPVAETPFDSPITGIPVAYPSGVGDVADQIYVGDADGTMWRVDVTAVTPQNWKARIAFDAYNRGSTNSATLRDAWIATGASKGSALALAPTADQAAVMGQPIQPSPVISLDALGNVVLTYATGDQEEFNTVSSGMVNMLVSFSDVIGATGYPPYQAKLDNDEGVELAFLDGARVTGPINLFDGQLYFAYFRPQNGLACAKGRGGICGISYNSRNAFKPIGLVDLNANGGIDDCTDFSSDEVVFGVSVSQVPSCVSDTSDFQDPYLGGSYQSITQSNLGRYQLSYHTGQGGTAHDGAKTKSATVNLPSPRSRTKVQSWVSVVE